MSVESLKKHRQLSGAVALPCTCCGMGRCLARTGPERQMDPGARDHAEVVLDHNTAPPNPVSDLEEWPAAYAQQKGLFKVSVQCFQSTN